MIIPICISAIIIIIVICTTVYQIFDNNTTEVKGILAEQINEIMISDFDNEVKIELIKLLIENHKH